MSTKTYRCSPARTTSRAGARQVLAVSGAAVLVICVCLVALAVIVLPHSGTAKSSDEPLAPPAVVKAITDVKTAQLNAVNLPSAGLLAPPKELPDEPLLVLSGKPEIIYMGALYCSSCAAERWPLAIALSRFGSWKGLHETYSASKPEPYPHTPSLSFDGASYVSPYITFASVEMQSDRPAGAPGHYAQLQAPTSEEVRLYDTFDASSGGKSAGVIPFIDYANQFVQVGGANYSPALLEGKTPQQVAASLADGKSDTGQAVLASADVVTAMICVATDGKPARVCNGSAVKTAFSGVLSSQITS